MLALQLEELLSWTPNVFPNGYAISGSDPSPFAAFDGDPTTMWNSGGWPTQWIEGWLWDYTHVSRIALTPFVDRPGQATNHLWARTANGWQRLSDFAGQWQGDGAKLIWTGSVDLNAIHVETDSGPSWVVWRDIMIYK